MTSMDTTAEAGAAEMVAWFAQGWTDPAYDEFCEYFLPRMHPQVRLAQPLAAPGVGHDKFRAQFAHLFATIPDIHAHVLRWSSKGPDVFIELTLEGTIGARPVSWQACDRLTVQDGLVVERRSFFDPTPLVKAIVLRPWAWPGLAVATARATSHGLRRERHDRAERRSRPVSRRAQRPTPRR